MLGIDSVIMKLTSFVSRHGGESVQRFCWLATETS